MLFNKNKHTNEARARHTKAQHASFLHLAFVAFVAFGVVFLILAWPRKLQAAPAKKAPMQMMLVRQLLPDNKVGIGFLDNELSSRHKYFERYQTLYADVEYQIRDFWSVYGRLPYSKRWQTDSPTTRRLDNIHMGSRLALRQGNRMRYGFGLDIELATGDEKKAAIGSKELGSAEPWFGLQYSRRWLWQAAIRYNAQTNKQFREREGQQFARTWFFDLVAGYRFSGLDLALEYSYKYRSDPETKALSTHTLAPAIHLRLGDDDSMLLSLAIPWALSREREWDHSLRMEFSYFY